MSDSSSSKSNRRQRFLFIIIVFLYWFSMYIYVPILSPYIEHLGASYTVIGIILGVYGLVQILCRLPIGMGSDYIKKRKPFIMLGIVACGVSCLGFTLTEQLGWTLAARAMAGVAASTWVVFTVGFATFYPKNEVSRAMSMMQFTMVIAQLSSMMISGYLVETYSWKVPFVLGGIVALIALVLSCFLKETQEDETRVRMSVKDLLPVMRDPMLFKVSFLSILAHCVLFITMFGYTPNQALNLGASKNDLAWLTLAFMVPHAVATLFAGKYFLTRFGEKVTLIVGFVGSAIFTWCIPIADDFKWLCITQIFNGFAQGLIFPLLLGKSVATIDYSKRATAMGFYQAVYAIGMFIGPFVAGWANSVWGLEGGFRLGAIVAFCASGLAFYWMGNNEQRHEVA
ncbi:MFS transporter [Paenibacillus crassostreae]|uniref:MFS transporter n=1 Tax=Paenibacillus crassostreae TaxID=1763538 RepID=A0A167AZ92_9BACL|nr:MFS transporter [Paenibacillus crassostreae]AOZ93565.1 MFS transporter [Paenibacillus crassostreae]OAB71598.1 MFS transporter [Paenibacillus crassostreae]